MPSTPSGSGSAAARHTGRYGHQAWFSDVYRRPVESFLKVLNFLFSPHIAMHAPTLVLS